MQNSPLFHSPSKVINIIERSYGNQIDLAGAYQGAGTTCTWYCHVCENWFHQNWSTIKRGTMTRCKCNYSKALPKEMSINGARGAGRFLGHRCLAEWDCYDRVPPERRVGVPRCPRKGA